MFILAMLASFVSSAQAGAYYNCEIFNGQVTSCTTWYQGETAVYKDGAYFKCSIFNGQVTSCTTWHQGSSVVYK